MKIINRILIFLIVVTLALGISACKPPQAETGQPMNNVFTGLKITFINVGAGDSAYILFPDGKNMLIDCGPDNEESVEKIVNVITESGKTHLDYLVITHVDSDHAGGGEELVKGFKVNKAFVPNVFHKERYPYFARTMAQLEGSESEIIYSEAYRILGTGGVSGVFLSPTAFEHVDSPYAAFNGKLEPSADEINMTSAVIYLEYAGVRFMLMADALAQNEATIIEKYEAGVYKSLGVNLRDIDFLKVGHHGANDASSYEFLSVLKPRSAIITCDGFSKVPSSDVLKRIVNASNNCEIYRTDTHGTITVCVGQAGEIRIIKEG